MHFVKKMQTKYKLALLIALEIKLGAKGMTIKNQQELHELTQKFYKCKSNV